MVNTIVTIVLIVIALAVIGAGIYFYVRDKSLSEIRAEVYQLFLKAEHNPEFGGFGKQKMKWVLSKARSLLPNWIQVFITDEFLEKVVEGWFRSVKDLLDDGKVNGSVNEDKAQVATEADGYEDAEEDDDDGESDIEKGN